MDEESVSVDRDYWAGLDEVSLSEGQRIKWETP